MYRNNTFGSIHWAVFCSSHTKHEKSLPTKNPQTLLTWCIEYSLKVLTSQSILLIVLLSLVSLNTFLSELVRFGSDWLRCLLWTACLPKLEVCLLLLLLFFNVLLRATGDRWRISFSIGDQYDTDKAIIIYQKLEILWNRFVLQYWCIHAYSNEYRLKKCEEL